MRGLEARVQMAMHSVYFGLGMTAPAVKALLAARALAYEEGENAGRAKDFQVPPLTAEDSQLTQVFYQALMHRPRENDHAVRTPMTGAKEGTTQDPHTIVHGLLAGERVRIQEHSLFYIDGITWYTNPYGQDGMLGECRDGCGIFGAHRCRLHLRSRPVLGS